MRFLIKFIILALNISNFLIVLDLKNYLSKILFSDVICNYLSSLSYYEVFWLQDNLFVQSV